MACWRAILALTLTTACATTPPVESLRPAPSDALGCARSALEQLGYDVADLPTGRVRAERTMRAVPIGLRTEMITVELLESEHAPTALHAVAEAFLAGEALRIGGGARPVRPDYQTAEDLKTVMDRCAEPNADEST